MSFIKKFFKNVEDEFYEQLGRIAWKKIKGDLDPKKIAVDKLDDLQDWIDDDIEGFVRELKKKLERD